MALRKSSREPAKRAAVRHRRAGTCRMSHLRQRKMADRSREGSRVRRLECSRGPNSGSESRMNGRWKKAGGASPRSPTPSATVDEGDVGSRTRRLHGARRQRRHHHRRRGVELGEPLHRCCGSVNPGLRRERSRPPPHAARAALVVDRNKTEAAGPQARGASRPSHRMRSAAAFILRTAAARDPRNMRSRASLASSRIRS